MSNHTEYSETFEIYKWDAERNCETTVVMSLEQAIVNPTGLKMATVGLQLFNLERRKRGLTEFRVNPTTGTIDEV